MEIENVPENLVKINVYYTSLNEKTIEDEIVYSVKVREFELKSEFPFLKILQSRKPIALGQDNVKSFCQGVGLGENQLFLPIAGHCEIDIGELLWVFFSN